MRRCFVVVLLFLFCTATIAIATDKGIALSKKKGKNSSERKRLALVIGNSVYKHSGALANPARDAELIAKTLRDVGFDLHGGGAQLNMTRRSLDQAIESFGDSIQPGDVALFYYSGHGLQVAGENYLVPVDANIKKESEVRVKTVPVNLLFAKLDGIPKAVNIVVLDACRNNPFARSFRSSGGGLASVSAPTGTLVAFSTAPGQVAEDGSGNNSTYTSALAKYVKEPGLSIEGVFKKVRSEVGAATSGQQTPWENTSLTGNFKFIDSDAMKAALAAAGDAKSAELERLLKMEAEAKVAKEREQTEIAARQAEVAKMDAEIMAMKARLGAGSATGNDSLDNMIAMVEQRQDQAEKLEVLRKQREVEESKRQRKITQLKIEEQEKRRAKVEASIVKYEKVANSPYGKDLADAAWQSLVGKYNGAQEIDKGDLSAFRLLVIEGVPISEIAIKKISKREKFDFLLGDEVVLKKMTAFFKNGRARHESCVNNISFDYAGTSYCREGSNKPVRVGDVIEIILVLRNNLKKSITGIVLNDHVQGAKYIPGSAMIDNNGDEVFEVSGDETCDQSGDFFEADSCKKSSNIKMIAFYVGSNANEIKERGFGGQGGNLKSDQIVAVKYRVKIE